MKCNKINNNILPISFNKNRVFLISFTICGLSNDKSYSENREKECYDYNNAICGNYTPEMKLCFNIDNSGCKEVQIDNRCQINECTGNSCTFDENNDRCYYK